MKEAERGLPPTPPARGTAPQGGNAPYRFHGARIRGADLSPRSPMFEGRFGRMFRTLPAARHTDEDLAALAAEITAESEEEATPETEADAEENTGISAGYTYLGQFIDHDLTFDPASSLQRENDPDALIDFRTPRFDLDCIYGRGPADQPYMYGSDGLRMLLGRPISGSAADPNTRDLPRNSPDIGPARALIGDPRNDENMIVAQLHAAILRFHNRMVDVLHDRLGHVPTFDAVQREVRWHYQWVVLHDFLPTIIGEEAVRAILPEFRRDVREKVPYSPDLRFYSYRRDPFIPVEFSVAAYRFGHSMVRPNYRLNTILPGRQSIFQFPLADTDESLAGFRAIPADRAIDWTLFFAIEERPRLGKARVQPAYKIDSSLVTPLGHLPESVATDEHALAARNLLRGRRMGLPSGQAVAWKMGLPIIPDELLRVGKATEEDQADNPRLVDMSPRFRHNAPLWYYILAEAQQAFSKDDTPIRLGPVGGRIVGEVFVGLLLGDAHSYLRQFPAWRPVQEFVRDGQFGIAELLLQGRQA